MTPVCSAGSPSCHFCSMSVWVPRGLPGKGTLNREPVLYTSGTWLPNMSPSAFPGAGRSSQANVRQSLLWHQPFIFFFFEIQVAIKHIRSFTSRSLASPQGTFLFSDSMAALDKQPQSIRQGEKQVGAHTRKLLRFLNSSRRGWLCKLAAAKVPRGRGRCGGTRGCRERSPAPAASIPLGP